MICGVCSGPTDDTPAFPGGRDLGTRGETHAVSAAQQVRHFFDTMGA